MTDEQNNTICGWWFMVFFCLFVFCICMCVCVCVCLGYEIMHFCVWMWVFFFAILLYLCVIVVHILLASVRRISMMLFARVKCVYDNLLRTLYFRPTKRTSLNRKLKTACYWRLFRGVSVFWTNPPQNW